MLGDGVIDNRRLPAAVDATGYNGAVEVKIFSVRDWRQHDPDEFVPTIKTRFSQDL